MQLTISWRWARPGKVLIARGDGRAAHAERAHAARAAAAFCQLCSPGRAGASAGEHMPNRFSRRRLMQDAVDGEDAAGLPSTGNGDDPRPGPGIMSAAIARLTLSSMPMTAVAPAPGRRKMRRLAAI
jgi:hypothetical protein